jgi:hypothetical protein
MRTLAFTVLVLLVSGAGTSEQARALDVIPDDLAQWTEVGEIIAETPGGWDEKSLQIFGIEKRSGTFFLYYGSGFDGCWDQHADVAHKSIGLATSSDGVNFTKHPANPVLVPHDFVPVSAHEEGIRLARIRWVEDLGKFVGYFGVEDPGGADTCPYGATSGCDCNISVDAFVYTASSADGINWTPEGEVSGAYNQDGNESYGSAFEYAGGNYYLWSHYASGGHTFHASKGTDNTSLTELGVVPELNFGWSPLETFLHDDNNTVTFIYVPNGPDYEGDELRFGTCTLDDPTVVTDVRLITNQGAHRFSAMLKDEDAGLWRWYYGYGAAGDPILLRTAPIEGGSSDVDPPGESVPIESAPNALRLSVSPNPFRESTRIEYTLASSEHVKASVFDMSGRWVTELVDSPQAAGRHTVVWNAGQESGPRLASGAYLISIEAGPWKEQRRIVFQR